MRHLRSEPGRALRMVATERVTEDIVIQEEGKALPVSLNDLSKALEHTCCKNALQYGVETAASG